MQELRVFAWCDVCYSKDKAQTPATNRYVVTVQVVGQRGAPILRGLDVCEQHNEPMAELKETLVSVGTVVPKEAPPPELPKVVKTALPPPEPKAKAPTTEHRTTAWGRVRLNCRLCGKETRRDNLTAHLMTRHGARPPVQPKKCPDCGERYDANKAMQQHRARRHDYVYMDEVYASVKRR